MAEDRKRYPNERHIISLHYTKRVFLETSLNDTHPIYSMGFEAEEIPPNALTVFRAYKEVLRLSGMDAWGPTCSTVWDIPTPTREQVLTEVGKGHLILSKGSKIKGTTQQEAPQWKALINDFLQRKVGFAELRKALVGDDGMGPRIGNTIMAEWPGHDGLKEFTISTIREDENGIKCAVFGEGSTVGAEAIDNLISVWYVKQSDTD